MNLNDLQNIKSVENKKKIIIIFNSMTSLDRRIPFFGLNSTDGSFETNSNLILKSGNEQMLRSITEAKFVALELIKICLIFIV